MTTVALGRRRQVGRVLACRGNAVMTTGARLGDCRVIKARGDPGRGIVAVVAFERSRYVPRVLAGRSHAVMAGGAGLRDRRMIEACAAPGDRSVAKIAFGSGLDMTGMFAGRSHAVMTRTAAAQYGAVVDPADAVEREYIVTVFTQFGRPDV